MTTPNTETFLFRFPAGVLTTTSRHRSKCRISLNKNQVRAVKCGYGSKAVVCHRGSIWITQERDLHDYLVEPGEIFILTLPGTTLVVALEDAQIEIIPSLKPIPYFGSYECAAFP